MINLFQYDWPAYAAIMGHEFAHLTLGHGADRKSREETRQGVSTVLGTLAGLVIPMGGTLVDIASHAVTTIYTRDEERDADREGLEYARKAGYEPEGALRAWQMMLTATGGGIPIPFLNTHPSTEERIATIKQSIAASKKAEIPSTPRQPSPVVVASNSVQPVASMPASIDGVFVPPPIQVAQTNKTPVSSPVPGKARISITSEPLRGMTTDVSVNGKRIATVGPDNPYKGEIFTGKSLVTVKGGEVSFDALPDHEYMLEVSLKPLSGGSFFLFGLAGSAALDKYEYSIALKETKIPEGFAETRAKIATVAEPSAKPKITPASAGVALTAQQRVIAAPTDYEAWAELGKQYQESGDADKAIRAYEQAHKLYPGNLEILESLGALYAKTGQKEKTQKVWEQLAQIDKARAESFFSQYILP